MCDQSITSLKSRLSPPRSHLSTSFPGSPLSLTRERNTGNEVESLVSPCNARVIVNPHPLRYTLKEGGDSLESKGI